MNRLKKVFGINKKPAELSTTSTIGNLREMEEMLVKKQVYLEEQVQIQLSLAKKHGLKNKRAALAALKRKKRFEIVLQQVDGTLSTLELQREALEQAKSNVSVLQAMKNAAQALKLAQQHMSVDKVHDVMDEVAEQQEVAVEISQAISSPMGSTFGNDFDDAELELELEAMEQEDLEKELLHVGPPTATKKDEAAAEVRKPLETGLKKAETVTEGPGGNKVADILDAELEELKSWAAA